MTYRSNEDMLREKLERAEENLVKADSIILSMHNDIQALRRDIETDRPGGTVHPHEHGRWFCPKCGTLRPSLTFAPDAMKNGVGIWDDYSLVRACETCGYAWRVSPKPERSMKPMKPNDFWIMSLWCMMGAAIGTATGYALGDWLS